MRQRTGSGLKPLTPASLRRDLHVEVMPLGCRRHARADVDAIDLDPLRRPAVPQQPGRAVAAAAAVSCTLAAVTSTASRKPSEQLSACRLIPLTRLLPSTPRSPCCGPDTTLCKSRIAVAGSAAWPRRRPHGAHQQTANIGPDAVGPESVVPTPNGFPRAETPWVGTPLAARLLQVEAGVDHLSQVDRQGLVAGKQRLDRSPLGIRQIARVTPPSSLYRSRCSAVHIEKQEQQLERAKKRATSWYLFLFFRRARTTS